MESELDERDHRTRLRAFFSSHDRARRRLLFESGSIVVYEAEWRRHTHRSDFRGGPSCVPTVLVPRLGAFLHGRPRRDPVACDANTFAAFNRNDETVFSHPHGNVIRHGGFLLATELVENIARESAECAYEPRVGFRTRNYRSDALATLALTRVTRTLRKTPTCGVSFEDEILRAVAVLITTALTPVRRETRSAIRRRIPHVQDYLANHCSKSLTLSALAGRFGCSAWALSRVFSQETGTTISRYLRKLRMRQSLEGILGGKNVLQVAMEHGYTSHSHFTAEFRREFGVAPRESRSS